MHPNIPSIIQCHEVTNEIWDLNLLNKIQNTLCAEVFTRFLKGEGMLALYQCWTHATNRREGGGLPQKINCAAQNLWNLEYIQSSVCVLKWQIEIVFYIIKFCIYFPSNLSMSLGTCNGCATKYYFFFEKTVILEGDPNFFITEIWEINTSSFIRIEQNK